MNELSSSRGNQQVFDLNQEQLNNLNFAQIGADRYSKYLNEEETHGSQRHKRNLFTRVIKTKNFQAIDGGENDRKSPSPNERSQKYINNQEDRQASMSDINPTSRESENALCMNPQEDD